MKHAVNLLLRMPSSFIDINRKRIEQACENIGSEFENEEEDRERFIAANMANHLVLVVLSNCRNKQEQE